MQLLCQDVVKRLSLQKGHTKWLEKILSDIWAVLHDVQVMLESYRDLEQKELEILSEKNQKDCNYE